MIHNYDSFNYWPLDTYELPSRGIFYKKDAKIKVRPLTVLEVKFLSSMMPATATHVCNELLEKCTIFENLEYDELLLPDREFIIFWIRLNSFTTKNGYTINLPECQGCKTPLEKHIKLEELDFKYLDNGFEPNVYLPDADINLTIAIPTYRSSMINTEDEFGDLAIYIDNDMSYKEKYDFVSNLTALDYITLKTAIDKNYCGIVHDVTVECPKCHMQYKVKLEINDQNLFCSVNLMEILETITRVCKYSNLQITNEWSWIEVEIEQQIINKMVEEENEYNRKEMAKANAKATSVHMPSMPHMPSYR